MVLVLVLACGPDLPAGWEDASPVEGFTQSECAGDALSDTGQQDVPGATATGGSVDVSVTAAQFRCSQAVEGFWRADGDALFVLVQPTDMHPSSVAKCDCLYDLQLTFPGSPGGLDAIFSPGPSVAQRS